MSKNFTGYDGWHRPGRPGTCAACSWAYTTTILRSAPHVIGPSTSLMVDAPTVRDLLTVGGLSLSCAVIYPLRPGRKHLLPAARWGAVTIDDVTLPWSGADAARLRLVVQLREHGFSGPALQQPAPPYAQLRTITPDRWSEVLAAWEQLQPWRQASTGTIGSWLDLAVHLTRDLTTSIRTRS